MIFEVPGSHFRYQNGVRNGVENGISMLKALESLLTGILEAMIALLEPFWALLDSQSGSEPLQENNKSATTACGEGGGEDKPLPGKWDLRV